MRILRQLRLPGVTTAGNCRSYPDTKHQVKRQRRIPHKCSTGLAHPCLQPVQNRSKDSLAVQGADGSTAAQVLHAQAVLCSHNVSDNPAALACGHGDTNSRCHPLLQALTVGMDTTCSCAQSLDWNTPNVATLLLSLLITMMTVSA